MNPQECLERWLDEFIANHEARIYVVVGPKEIRGMAARIEHGWLVLSTDGPNPHYVLVKDISAWGPIRD